MKKKTKAQINMVFTFIATLLIIGAIVLIATHLLGHTIKDKCTADTLVFSNKLKEAIKTNNDYGGVNQGIFLAPCDYKKMCLVDYRALDAIHYGTIAGGFRIHAALSFSGGTLINDSVTSGVQKNIFLINNEGKVLDAGFSPQLELSNPQNVTCVTAKQGKFTLIFSGKGRTTLISEP